MSTPETAQNASEGGPVLDRSIGNIMAELRHLSAQQVEQVLQHQKQHDLRFGEAAVALGLASKDRKSVV